MSTKTASFIDTFRAGTVEPIAIRAAADADLVAVARVAQRDSAPVPRRPLLVAEAGGEVRAAISLADRSTIADPFHPTADLVALLRARADQARTVRAWPRRVAARTPVALTGSS
jgi:hypothetical protein